MGDCKHKWVEADVYSGTYVSCALCREVLDAPKYLTCGACKTNVCYVCAVVDVLGPSQIDKAPPILSKSRPKVEKVQAGDDWLFIGVGLDSLDIEIEEEVEADFEIVEDDIISQDIITETELLLDADPWEEETDPMLWIEVEPMMPPYTD